MPHFLGLLLLLGFLNSAFAAEQDPPIVTDKDIKISLYSNSGQNTPVFLLNYEDPNTDILFHYEVPKHQDNYVSWAFEVTQPKQNQAYQMAFEGHLPKIIHWDGYFDAKSSVQVQQKYFVRLLLVKKDNQIAASEWREFTVLPMKEKPAPLDPSRDPDFYISPTAGILLSTVQSNAVASLSSMHYQTNVRFYLGRRSTLEAKWESTAPFAIALSNGDTAFTFSSLSFYYRFRFFGAPSRPPSFSVIPSYIPRKRQQREYGGEFYGPRFNLELGLGYFHQVLRSEQNSALDAVLPGQMNGASAVLKADEQIGRFRFFQGVEVGSTLITGSVFSMSGELALGYDYFENVEPALYARYTLFNGNTLATSINPLLPISGSILSFGLMIQLKV